MSIPLPNKNRADDFVSHNERALLSLSLKDPKNLAEISSKISEDFFLFPPHRIIFNAMSTLMKHVSRIDLNTLSIRCEELGLDKQLRDQYLPLLTNCEFDDSSLKVHLDSVKNAYLKYQLFLSMEKSLSKVLEHRSAESNLTANDLISFVSREISKLDACRGLEDNVVSFGEALRGIVNEMAETSTDVRGYRTGFDQLDKEINGLLRGEMAVIAARKKTGKSAMLVNIADHVAYQTNQCSVLFLSTEMSKVQDGLRTLAIRTLVNQRELLNGTAIKDPKKKRLIEAGLKQIEGSPCQVYHEYIPSFTVESVVAKAKYWNRKLDNLGLVIFDYIKMPTARDANQGDAKEYQLWGDLATALKNQVAGEENLAVLTACQLNRENEVADSDRIARYASNMLHLRWQTKAELAEHGDYEKHGTHLLQIRDTRDGGSGKIFIRFYQTCLKMEEAEPYFAEEEGVNERPVIHSPLDKSKIVEQKYTMPKNVPEGALKMSINEILTGYDQEDVKKKLMEQVGSDLANES